MDPLTVWIFCLATAWFIRRAVEDGWASINGRESPRIAQRRAKQELAQQGGRTIGQAVSGRIADRIAEPREAGPLRRYLADLWEDSWEDARVRHEDRRRRRAEREQQELDVVDAPDDDEVRTYPCRGAGCDVLVVEPAKWCDDCLAQMRNDQARRAEPKPEHVLRTRPCRGKCGVLIVEPQEWCTVCAARWTSSTPPPTQPQPEPKPAAKQQPSQSPPQPDGRRDRIPGLCRVCLAHPVATDISGRCEKCARGNFGHKHYCATGCGRPVNEQGQTCPTCAQDAAENKRYYCAGTGHVCNQRVHEHGQLCPDCALRRADIHAAASSSARTEARLAADAEKKRRAHEYGQRLVREWEERNAKAKAAGQMPYCAGVTTAGLCRERVHESGQLCPYCARSDADRYGSTAQTHQTPEPAPAPAPDTTRKDTQPVTTTEIDGDVTGPQDALAFADSCLALNNAVINELDVMAANLEGEGVGDDVVRIVRDAQAAADQFASAAGGARDEYARHVATQAEIASNPELRDTVKDTYLDTARA